MGPHTLRARDRLRPIAAAAPKAVPTAPTSGPPAPNADATDASRSIGWRAMQALCRCGGEAPQEQVRAELALAADRMPALVSGLRHNGYVRRDDRPEGLVLVLTPEGRAWAQAAGLAIPAKAVEQAAPAHAPSDEPQRGDTAPERARPEVPPSDGAITADARRLAGGPVRASRQQGYRTDAAGFITHINGRPLF